MGKASRIYLHANLTSDRRRDMMPHSTLLMSSSSDRKIDGIEISESPAQEELHSIRVGIWSGLFYLLLRDLKTDLSPLLVMVLCIGQAELINWWRRLPQVLCEILSKSLSSECPPSDVQNTPASSVEHQRDASQKKTHNND